MKILIIDGNNIAYKNLFNSPNPEDDVDFSLWRHKFLSNIIDYLEQFKPDEAILVFDVKNSWRYDIYPRYKEKRASFKENSKVDFDKFYPALSEFSKDIKTYFTSLKVISLDRTEGDDIVAILSKKFESEDKDVVIISADKDFYQLHSPKIKQYNPVQRQFIEVINPQMEKTIKVLIGDMKSDSIPAIKKRFGVVSATKVIKEGLDTFLDLPENKEIKLNYIRNQRLIDFDFIPDYIKESIINSYNSYDFKSIDSLKIIRFFKKYKLEYLWKSWTIIAPNFRNLEKNVRKMQEECIQVDRGGS